MISVQVIKGANGDLLVGSIKMERFNVPFDKNLYDELMVLSNKSKKVTTSEEYDAIMDEATAKLTDDRKSEIETACKDIIKLKGNYHIKGVTEEGELKISKYKIPESFVMKITEAIEKGIDATPLVKAWILFMRNEPARKGDFNKKAKLFCNYVTSTIVDRADKLKFIEEGYSVQMAEEMATYNDVAVTDEGLICCYKYAELITKMWEVDQETNKVVLVDKFKVTKTVDPNGDGTPVIKQKLPKFADDAAIEFLPPIMGKSGDAFFCDDTLGHTMKVGSMIALDSWDKVDCNDNRCGCPGLHVGGRAYVNGYAGRFNQLLECFVSPSDMGAFVDLERGDGAIRCRRYFVYGAAGKPTKNLFHSSKVAAMLEDEWQDAKMEAIMAAELSVEDAKSAL